MIGLKNIYKLMHVIILGFAFFAPNAHAQIPVVDFASISNGAKDIVNTVKESKLVMDATALASKATHVADSGRWIFDPLLSCLSR